MHPKNYGVYGAPKVHAQLRRDGHPVARSTVERLMRRVGLLGVSRRKGPPPTVSGPFSDRAGDLVDRPCTAPARTACGGPGKTIRTRRRLEFD
ncbi:IS3 family transposase [Microterricola viridarii]|uniref:IS3 family transposase n=1 Tax=Microterricola viridarii TaxID=412690 RepID=UPI001561067A